LVVIIIVYTYSLTKLEIRAKQFLPASKRVGRRGRKWRGEGSGGGKGEEMTQILYAHMNKTNKNK
jgi:hypothetical protein